MCYNTNISFYAERLCFRGACFFAAVAAAAITTTSTTPGPAALS